MRTPFCLLTNCLTAVACALLVLAATGHAPAAPAPSPDTRFDAFKRQFLLALWRQDPELATTKGYHKYDSLLVIPDAAQRQRDAAFAKKNLATLGTFELARLSPANQIDLRLLRNELRARRWYADTLREWQWNPATYNLGSVVAPLLNGRYYRLDRRLRNISDKISHAADYYAAARANISTPTKEHTELALQQLAGGLAVFGPALADSVQRSGLRAAEKQAFMARVAATRQAMQGYLDFLKNEVLPAGQFRSFRIGQKLYDQKFAYDIQSPFPAEAVYRQAQQHKTDLLHDMGRRAARLYPTYLPGQKAPADTLALIAAVLDQLSRKHASREGLVDAARAQIPTLVAFVNEKKLLTQDPTKPLVVRETPPYLRGSGVVAGVLPPGPYDPAAATYYYITPIPGEWTATQAESFLREYNDYTLQIVNIHEAIPGHYTQLMYANRSPSLVKSLFWNGAMAEGWAVYAERMMLENGYGNNADEMWLIEDKNNMRVTLNTIIDRAIQVNNMSENQVVAMLRREGFQEEAEARGKWRRATLSQVQLSSYFAGYSAILTLRDELKRQQGPAFGLKAFHEQFLSYGTAPVKYIRELMLAPSGSRP
ncbi:hypothetical protein AUC43_17275 [Hymenobacter sedentarius]|uniref:DUF885 domain-containing protein n=1 Tax=Hymenobacter sedentarius TaxID=1411621 RepID=A0A0U4ASW1_9BACT|nr:DUF885 domain-containing protein [Hymenobacter sedentarius]ALW86677.1 hypothetical protein AUC43_17275 [Hymenobacter sedentarius]